MISEAEFNAIKAKVDAGEMPTPEELEAVVEYATEEAKRAYAANPVSPTCVHCGAPVDASTIENGLICEYCGNLVVNDPQGPNSLG